MNEKEYFKNFVLIELVIFVISTLLGIGAYTVFGFTSLLAKTGIITLGVISAVTFVNAIKGTIEYVVRKIEKKHCNFKGDSEINETLDKIYKRLDEEQKQQEISKSKENSVSKDPQIEDITELIYRNMDVVGCIGAVTGTQLKRIDEARKAKQKQLVLTNENIKENR